MQIKAKTKTSAPATTAPATVAAPTYTLSAAALALAAQGTGAGNTLQRTQVGLGKAWRTTATAAPNTRAVVLAAIAAATNGKPFTAAQAQAAIPRTACGSGSPRSYVVAFVKNGYFAPVGGA